MIVMAKKWKAGGPESGTATKFLQLISQLIQNLINEQDVSKNNKITKEEYLKWWAEAARISVADVKKLGLDVYPCGCGNDACEGWVVST